MRGRNPRRLRRGGGQQIATWLIKARIARGLRQEDLARLLKLQKQQIQHYEATDYAGASLRRLKQILATICSYSSNELQSGPAKARINGSTKAAAAYRPRSQKSRNS